jgi:hypothetical protein
MTVTVLMWLILMGTHLLAAVIGWWGAVTWTLIRLGRIAEDKEDRDSGTNP